MIATQVPALASEAGLRRGRNGNWAAPGSKRSWAIVPGRNVLRLQAACKLAPGAEWLEAHADLAGPVKLVGKPRPAIRVEYFLGPDENDSQRLIDPSAAEQSDRLLARLIELGSTLGQRQRVDGWEPPDAGRLAGWLSQLGYETATDQQENLRLTLKRPGRDGQVRIERGTGRLRLAMPLGSWPALDGAPRSAMSALAGQFNDRTAIVRIAWLGEASGRQRAEAQVDLSGIPCTPADDPGLQELWRQLLRGATAGLQLALAQLALELDTLADENHRELVEALL